MQSMQVRARSNPGTRVIRLDGGTMNRMLGYLLSLALVGTAGAQTPSPGSGSQTGSGSQADQGSKAPPQGRSTPQAKAGSKAKSGEQKFHSLLKSSNDVNAPAAGSTTPSG